jgi:hypothetical protein
MHLMRPLSLPSLSASLFFADGSPLLIYMESLNYARWLSYAVHLLCSNHSEQRRRTDQTGTAKFPGPASRRVAETLSDAGLQVHLEVRGRWKYVFITSIRFFPISPYRSIAVLPYIRPGTHVLFHCHYIAQYVFWYLGNLSWYKNYGIYQVPLMTISVQQYTFMWRYSYTLLSDQHT